MDDGEDLSLDDLALVVRTTVDKMVRETPATFIQFGTIQSVSQIPGTGPTALIHMDGDNPANFIEVASLIGVILYAGLRVAVIFDKPHGAYIVGSPTVSGVPFARAGFCRGGIG